jgi:hypothetical protein
VSVLTLDGSAIKGRTLGKRVPAGQILLGVCFMGVAHEPIVGGVEEV